MKKLVLFFAAVLLTAISSNLFAQGTYIAPEVGSVHTYQVTLNGTNTYLWDVTSDVGGSTSVATNNGGSVATLSSTTGNSITITWDNPSIGTTYYVHVTETDATNSCTNHKALAVTPVNNFTLTFVTTQSDNTDNAIDTDWLVCPPDVIVNAYNGSTPPNDAADAQNFTYDYGTTYLYYHITADGLNTSTTDWIPSVTATIDANLDAHVIASWGTYDGTTWTELEDDGNIDNNSTFSYTASNRDNIYLRLAVAHSTTYEGTASGDITLEVTGADENGNTVTDVNSKSATSDTELQTVKARPATTVIGN
jgi:hypothetical protein